MGALLVTKRCDEDDAKSYGAVENHNSNKCCLPKRYLVAILSFLGFANTYLLRINLSVAIVSMVSNKTGFYPNGTEYVISRPEFNWDTKLQGLILSSFYYGYIFTQLPGAYLASKFGGKNLFGLGILTTSFLTLFTPVAARCSPHLLVAVRVLEGLFEGVTYPANYAIWSKWAPPLERSKLVSISFSGPFAGVVFGMPLSGVIVYNLGWPYVFYISGVFGILWSFFWFALVTDSPKDQPKITKDELKYILSSLREDHTDKQVTSTPWKKILTSVPVWSINVASFADMWGWYTLLAGLPTYLKRTLNFTLQEASLLSSAPYVALVIVCQSGGILADFLITKNILTTTATRRLFNTVGFMSGAAFLLVVGYTSSKVVAIVGITLAVGLNGFTLSGFTVNRLDIAPRYADIICGISNALGTIPGIVSPLVIGVLTPHETKAEWRIVFILSAGVFLFGMLFYAIFVSGEKQSWADGEYSSNTENDERKQLVSHDSDE